MKKPPAKFATILGQPYCYYDEGPVDAPAVVFLHGFANCKDAGLPFIERFSSKYRVISPDLPGHNDVPLGEIGSISDYADYIAGLIQHLRVGRRTFVGFSMGGLITLKYCEACKDGSCLPGAMVWASPVGGFSTITPPIQIGLTAIGLIPQKTYQKIVTPESLMSISKKVGFDLSESDAAVFGKLTKNAAVRIRNMMRAFEYPDSISVKRLHLFDPKDPVVNYTKCMSYLTEKKVDADIEVLPGCGHFFGKDGLDSVLSRTEKYLSSLEN